MEHVCSCALRTKLGSIFNSWENLGLLLFSAGEDFCDGYARNPFFIGAILRC